MCSEEDTQSKTHTLPGHPVVILFFSLSLSLSFSFSFSPPVSVCRNLVVGPFASFFVLPQ